MVFIRHIGIDYSGAETPVASLKGLRVYMAEDEASPVEVQPLSGVSASETDLAA